MSKQRGWCPKCRGPLFRDDGSTLRDCRLCYLDALTSQTITDYARCFHEEPMRSVRVSHGNYRAPWVDMARVHAWNSRDPRWGNDTASPATSEWLPRVWVDGSHIRLSGDVINGDVVFFRYHDGVEVSAASTLLAKILRDEAADVAA